MSDVPGAATAHGASDGTPGPARAPLSGVRRLLVLMPSWVGDATMATPLLRALRDALPAARLAALCRPGIAAVLDGLPSLDERFTAPMRGFAGPWTGLAAARSFGADAVLLLPNSVRSGLASLRLAPRRLGYRSLGRVWTLTHALERPSRTAPESAVDSYANLGEWAIGRAIEDRRVRLVVTPTESTAADALLGTADARPGRRWLVVNPGANRTDKRWPAARFALAAATVAVEHSMDVAVTGAPGERSLVASVAAATRAELARRSSPKARVIDLVEHGVTLGSLKGVIARAALLITNDTGPRHVAAALGTPSVVLFGPTDHRWTTLAPTGAARDRLLLAEPFLPGTLMADRVPGVCRIDRISVGDAVNAAGAVLAQRR